MNLFRFKIDDDLIRAYPLRGYTRLPIKQSLRDRLSSHDHVERDNDSRNSVVDFLLA